jgi:uncharacterized protein (DUF952 family)
MIFKIAAASDWTAAERAGIFNGSAHDKADGFIHFSTATQLAETLRLYYAGEENLLLIAVDDALLGAVLKWEYAASRGENFPHLFAPLPLSAVTWKHPLLRDAQGTFVLPDTVFSEANPQMSEGLTTADNPAARAVIASTA